MINFGDVTCPNEECKTYGDMELLTDPDLLKHHGQMPEDLDLRCHKCSKHFKYKLKKPTPIPGMISEVDF